MKSIIDDTRGQAMTSPTWPLYLVVVAAIILVWEIAKDAAAWASTVTLDGVTSAVVSWATTATFTPLAMAVFVVSTALLTAAVVWMWENPRAGIQERTDGEHG